MPKIEVILLAINFVLALSLSTFVLLGQKKKMSSDVLNKSIAVLPFSNLSNDPDQSYFSDGIAEDILNHLVKISDLRVKSRTSTLKYKDSKKNIFEIGQELGVQSILEGTIRKAGNMVRIAVKLIDATRDENVWSETYDREIKDILSLQSEIAIEISRALKARLTHSEETNINTQAPINITAYDYFLKARQIINSSNDERADYEITLQLLNRAIAHDSKFAGAYALKAKVWYWLGTYGIHYRTWRDSSLHNSSTAIKLNPTQPEGYLVRSSVLQLLNNVKGSMEDLQKAHEVAPNDPEVLEALGYKLLQVRDKGVQKCS